MNKKVTEPYLVDALSFTEAEARIIEAVSYTHLIQIHYEHKVPLFYMKDLSTHSMLAVSYTHLRRKQCKDSQKLNGYKKLPCILRENFIGEPGRYVLSLIHICW